jgi:hypothetical protein
MKASLTRRKRVLRHRILVDVSLYNQSVQKSFPDEMIPALVEVD